MIARDFKRVVLIIGPFLFLVYVGIRCLNFRDSSSGFNTWFDHIFAPNWRQDDELQPHSWPAPSAAPTQVQPVDGVLNPPPASKQTHHEIFSTSTFNKKFFTIRFGDEAAINPNVIPHPSIENTFIIIAQKRKTHGDTSEHVELVCNAVFTLEGLICLEAPTALPIAATKSGADKCPPKLAYIAMNVGPHDARVFYGPRAPFIVFGSNSIFACFGQFIQDFRVLGDWGFEMSLDQGFGLGTELQRPPPWGTMEKNWFPFWDEEGAIYVHHDVSPKRVFAKLNADGSVGSDLAPLAAGDEACLSRYMPKLPPDLESIHQATNSLSITFCKRSDPNCRATSDNTFVFTVFQHKTFYQFHSEYEPYVMVFRQKAPFEVFAMSKRPIWIHGREERDDGGSDMFYVTSMSWKRKDQKYHGFLDDVLFLSFGIEDQRAGAIDVLAEDLLAELGTCLEA
ncbi:hypothetical protein CORC01_08446 [Colletotrichum orchidophilum]|uniref:Uncharacterized protein n=1 Tax=Colletotrichum orchidophilum TaxID=1209926 RepID=A0A1G4B467_9PEZI|nr:uncharacterized protein CORC01_08446 [Colletotrichum orchidophilum]OHE96228.1 hypothetical protein CORC01_08446 [Colletotrichum orchidophilum]